MHRYWRYTIAGMFALFLWGAGLAEAENDRYSLSVAVRPVGYQGLQGVGKGTITLDPEPPADGYQVGTMVTITVTPEDVDDLQSFVFEWTGDIPAGIGAAPHLNLTTFTVIMNDHREIQVLLSREYQAGDGAGDLDRDGLPDEWEVFWGLDPKDATGVNGRDGNPSNDYLPWDSWPLPANLLADGGYSKGRIPFNNFLQCRGFDGLYTTIPGVPGSGSPGLNPLSNDTDGDGLPDGWEYYFWALRGAGSDAPLDWVTIDPLNPDTSYNDDDGDGLTNLQEYNLGTDPTHADTDRDGMDDEWEFRMGLNPLKDDAGENPSGDYMAFAIINGIPHYHVDVYRAGAPSMEAGDTNFDPRTAWDHGTPPDTVPYTNLDEYLGGDRLPEKLWDADGFVTDANFSSDSTNPLTRDTDGDGIPDGWELYVGMNPNHPDDATDDPDEDGLSNLLEWANHTSSFGQSEALGDWTNKPWPTDPGVADRVFAWQNVWYDVNGDGIYEDGVDIRVWDGGHADGWTTPDGTVGRADPLRPSRVDGIPYAPIVYDPDNNSAWADLDGDGVFTPGVDIPSTMLPPNAGDTGTGSNLFFYHNDPHPWDTDFDGLPDSTPLGGGERGANTNPTAVDTDGDKLPDGWERYAGTDPLVADAMDDPDGDGLLNFQEYWTGTVFEWNHIDPRWPDVPGAEYGQPRMMTRRPMRWDGDDDQQTRTIGQLPYFLPPDFVSCPSFNVAHGQRAETARPWQWYKTTLANEADSDSDGMDDYWEVFHGLNPIKGSRDFMTDPECCGERLIGTGASAGGWDADPSTPGVFKIGMPGNPFTGVDQLIESLNAGNADLHVGPFNFGLELMDPDADGIPNIEEYSYDTGGRVYHHTDPTPYQRMDPYGTDPLGSGRPYSFSYENYTFDNIGADRFDHPYYEWPTYVEYDGFIMPFRIGVNEGFDTDMDGIGDLAEIAQAQLGEIGSMGHTDPVNSMDPMRNRAVRLVRQNEDFLRTMGAWPVSGWCAAGVPLDWMTRFTVEAWVFPDDFDSSDELQIVVERAARFPNMWGESLTRANFSLGIHSATRTPFVMYNGRGAFDTTIVSAGPAMELPAGEWSHLAGVYNGTHLRLYVNGELAGSVPSTLLPATGAPTSSGGFYRWCSTVVGARETQTVGVPVFWWSSLGEPLDVHSFYDGWIDEIRVWNGTRSEGDIQATMRTKLPREVTTATAQLAHYFSFDDNPDLDINWPGGVSQSPVPGDMEYLQGPNLPVHQTLDIWANTPQRSTVYDGHPWMPYNYIVYAKDLTAHAPVVPPEDDRIHVITNDDGSLSLPPGYKNSSNPYADDHTGNLLYMNSARADGDVFTIEAWMTGEPMADPDSVDSNNDGIPDWWYIQYGFDPYGPSIAYVDTSGDGLWNINKYRTGLNPLVRDTYGDGIMDGFRDSDGDGLNNLYEQNISGTRVDLVDTDDDGLTDWEEVMGQRVPPGWEPFDPLPAVDPGMISSPINSLDPPNRNSLRVDGDGHLALNHQARHSLKSWTLQAWVRPDPGSEGILIRRRVFNSFHYEWGVNYELGLVVDPDTGFLRPYTRYIGFDEDGDPVVEKRVDGSTPGEVTGGQLVTTLIPELEWTHLAATYDSASSTLRLYIDGALSAYRTDAFPPMGLGMFEDRTYRGEVTIGGGHVQSGVVKDGFTGHLDEVMILSGAVSAEGIQQLAGRADSLSAALQYAPEPSSYAPSMFPLDEALVHDHADDRILVRFLTGITQDEAEMLGEDMGLSLSHSYQISPVHLMAIADGLTLSQKLAQVRSHASVKYAEPDYKMQTMRTPNDAMYAQQWALRNTGQTGGAEGADINAESAWDLTTGSPGTLVAVIDTGIDYNHSDLAANMWAGHGYDFWGDTSDPMDDDGHGTHVAGIIGAVGNNGLGIAGVNWQTRLMAVRFIGPYGFGFTSDAIRAVEYAWMNGARISNNSWGSYGYSQALFDAIQTAGNMGHLFVAAAGNYYFDNDIIPFYPASYALPNIISVAAMDDTGDRSFFSNYGKQSVHLAAPGSSILSTLPNNGYGSFSGTSMAAPHVTGVAALILSQNPGLSYSAIRQMILKSAHVTDEWDGLVQTGGRLNAARAVGGAGTPVAYFSFNDGGSDYDWGAPTAEDFTVAQDWDNNWFHAGRFVNDAAFSDAEVFDDKIDSNNDGIPDWWYRAYGFDPFGPSIAYEDPDGDGLINLYEYLAGTHPLMPDSNMDGTSDAHTDSNGDGLTNLQKQELGLHPLLWDTDDDGISDFDEVQAGTDPLNPYDPDQFGAVELFGNGRLRIRTERDIDVHTNWTVEAWIRPAHAGVSGIVLRRAERIPFQGLRWIDYELGLDENVPYITYAYRQGATLVTERVDAIRPIGVEWTHVAAVMDDEDHQLRLFVNGKRVAYKRPAIRPPVTVYGAFESTIGGGHLDAAGNVVEGFEGQIDAVRVWDYARTGLEIQNSRSELLPEFAGLKPDARRAPIRIFNFDTRGEFAHNSRYTNDWMIGWLHAAEFQGDATWADAVWAPLTLDSDDDGLSDHEERTSGWEVYRSESPLVYRALSFDAAAGDVFVDELVDNEETGLYALTNWTVEAWVRPTELPSGMAPVVRRRAKGTGRVTFELGVVENGGAVYPYTRFQRDDAGHNFVTLTHNVPLPVGTDPDDWTHIAATFKNGAYSLFVNGGRIKYDTGVGAMPFVGGAGEVLLGSEPFIGHLQEVRIWNAPRAQQDIMDNYRKVLLLSAALLESSFDGGVSHLGRDTESFEDGLAYDHSRWLPFETFMLRYGRRTHKFSMAAWVKMNPGAQGGIVAERKVDLMLLPEEPDWRPNHRLRITDEGLPRLEWQGQVTIYTPIYEGEDDDDDEGQQRVLVDIEQAQEVVTGNLTSEVDIRDGQWHHIAVVGDSVGIRMYINGILDRRISRYYTFMERPGPSFEGFYRTYMPVNSALRIADDGLEAMVDEVMFWNEDLTQDEIRRFMRYGLTKADIKGGLEPIDPLPAFAVDPEEPRQRLVSYVTFDGELEMPWVPDRANEDMDYRILPQPTLSEIVTPSAPPILADRIRTYERQLRGYFTGMDGGEHVENYMERNEFGHAGLFRGTAEFVDVDRDTLNHLEKDSSGDGMPDWWKSIYGLDPGSSVGVHGPWGDPDGDGLPNIAEYWAGTDPMNWDTAGDGFADFDSIGPGEVFTWGMLHTDWDGMADEWEARFPGVISPLVYDAHLDPDGDGWSNFAEFMADTDPADPNSFPQPVMNVRFSYNGPHNEGPVVVHFYNSSCMGGEPVAVGAVHEQEGGEGTILTYPYEGHLDIVAGHLREGDTWAFAFIDRDGTGEWNPGDPAGLAQGQPIHVGWGEIPKVTFGLTDRLPGYHRFRWDPVEGQDEYQVLIRRRTTAGMPYVFDRVISGRTYVHEGDYLHENMFGLPAGNSYGPEFEWFAGGQSGIFHDEWATVVPQPVAHAPAGNVVFARQSFEWTMSTNATAARVQIRKNDADGPVVFEQTLAAPIRLANGRSVWDAPLYFGDRVLTNGGTYVWRVREVNPRSESAYSQYRAFTVNLGEAGGAHSIGGDVHYFGPAQTTNVVVQAFRSPGFSGRPDAQITLTNTGPYSLKGLRPGAYHVRAFINQKPAVLEYWESWGFVKDYEYATDYIVKPITVPGNKMGRHIVIRDRDTNNNGIPDAWEFEQFGSLQDADQSAWENWILWQIDSSGDGLSDGQKIAMGLNPNRIDTHEDGIPDVLRIVLGLDPTDPDVVPPPEQRGLFVITDIALTPDADVVFYASHPDVPQIHTNVRAYVSGTSDLTGSFQAVNDSGRRITPSEWAGFWTYTNMAPTNKSMFYRIQWKADP